MITYTGNGVQDGTTLSEDITFGKSGELTDRPYQLCRFASLKNWQHSRVQKKRISTFVRIVLYRHVFHERIPPIQE
ncbi:hypothetical protein Fuma_03665 [Fuerstiella marisgermanici]|uniref:Uncharacterized protein n=1 Tax=Fuerstiella marisgermanici TaxID=1891926 RepID=A0A1P8WJ18_9PLAN|nr:hypothetical protein Fuma_03665 [Fuerstiella marisgermanici]